MPLVIHPSSCCDICLDPYSNSSDRANSPHAIECGHIFCLGCLHSLNTETCPLCREPFDPDRAKKLHVGNSPRQESAEQPGDDAERGIVEQGVVHDHAGFLLHRMSLVSGEGTPEVEVAEVVSEVQEWLQSQPDDLNSNIPLRAALDSLQRYKALQHESEREKAECRRLRDQLRNSTLTTDEGSRTSRAMQDSLLSRIEEMENEHALELSRLQSQLQNLENLQPRHLIINTNTLSPRSNSLRRAMDLDTHMRTGYPIVFSLIVFCSIIELSISAWLTSRFTAYHNYFSLAERDRTRFLLFTSTWTTVFSGLYMFFSFYLPGSVLSSVASHFLFLFLTWAFWTAGATSITFALSGELNSNTKNIFAYPVQLNALQGFAWVTEALVTFALLAVVIRGILVIRRGDGLRGQLIA